MTKKKEKLKDDKEINKKESTSNEKMAEDSIKNGIKPQIDKNMDVQKSEGELEKKEELLGSKEPTILQLEYFSKDDLIKKVKNLENLIKEKESKLKELNDWKDKYIRLQAEFDNTQKRWEKNRQYLKGQYSAEVLRNFLPLYDSFKKALEATKDNNQIMQFYNQFMNILKFQGAELIKTEKNDLFNYNIHEAMTSIERDDIPENTIVDVIQDGWKYNKDVLRYVKVVLSKKTKPPEPKPTPEKAIDVEKKIESDSNLKKEDESPKMEPNNEQINEKNQKSKEGNGFNTKSNKNEYVS
jgi:molecular chaperone GrpE